MRKSSCMSLLAMSVLAMVMATQVFGGDVPKSSDVVASDAYSEPHVIGNVELHKYLQNSQREAMESRQQIMNMLDRQGMKAEIQKAGSSLSKIKTQLALLSDEEALLLNKQLMNLDLQGETAGGAGGVIVGLILFALSIYFLYQKLS
jgi:hypothetical protein